MVNKHQDLEDEFIRGAVNAASIMIDKTGTAQQAVEEFVTSCNLYASKLRDAEQIVQDQTEGEQVQEQSKDPELLPVDAAQDAAKTE